MVNFTPYDTQEARLLADWLVSDTWDYYVEPNPTRENVEARIAAGAYHSEDTRTFWIDLDEKRRVGLIRLYDLLEDGAMFDIRIRTAFRGMGIGRAALQWLTAHVFLHHPDIRRIEGQTRQDNGAMRHLLQEVGYAKEAHYRATWRAEDGQYLDTIGYGMLRSDFVEGRRTPVHWADEDGRKVEVSRRG